MFKPHSKADTSHSNPSPPASKFFIALGAGVVAAVFGGLALWSVAAPIDGAVIASGQVIVEGNRKVVQHLEGGVIKEILVHEGMQVRQGDVVARLDDITQKANLALVDGQLAELYARRARLEAERDAMAEIRAPRGVADVLNSSGFKDKYDGQIQLMAARTITRATQLSLLGERIVQQHERIAGREAQVTSLLEQKVLIRDELDGVRQLHDQGFAPTTRLRALEREAKRLGGESGALRAEIAEAHSIIAETNLEIERLKEIGREEAIAELRDVDVSIVEMEERRITAGDALKRTDIRAPQSGRVLGLAVHTVGGVVAPGAPLMEIVPDGNRLLIAARLAPQDVDKVQAGQKTLVRFSNFGSRQTPEADGIVKTVSADSLTDEAIGASYYLVFVDIPEGDDLSALLSGRSLAPGMPVETYIRTGSKPAIEYLLKPLTDAMARSMRED